MYKFLALFSLFLSLGYFAAESHNENKVSNFNSQQTIVDRTVDGAVDKDKTLEFNFRPFYKTAVDKENNVIYVGRVDSYLFRTILDETNRAIKEGRKEITLDFHSPGGSVFYMELIIIQLNLAKEKGLKINHRMQTGSMCASACPAIFIQGDTREVHPHSVIMLHSPYIRGLNRLSDPEKIYYNKSLANTRAFYISLFNEACGKDNKWMFNSIMDLKDHYYYSSAVTKGCNDFYTGFSQKSYPIYLPAYGITERKVDVVE